MFVTRSVVLLVLAAGTVAGMTSAALADEPPLKGPSVKERNVPGVDGRFGEGQSESARRAGSDRLPPRAFRDALDTVLSPDAPADIRASDSQREAIEAMISDFEQQSRAYMQQHRDKLQALRAKAGEFNRPKKPGQPAADGQSAGGDAIAAREELRAIMAGAPKIDDLQTKVWAELSPAQQKAVDAKLQVHREKSSLWRLVLFVSLRLGRKNPSGGAAARPGALGAGGPAERSTPERRERFMRLLARLSPEQQDELMRRIEARLAESGGDGGADNATDEPPRRRPARGRTGKPAEGPGAPPADADPMQPQNP